MRKLMLLAGAATLLIGQPVLAQGKGHGGGGQGQGGGGQGGHQGGGKGQGGGGQGGHQGGGKGQGGGGQGNHQGGGKGQGGGGQSAQQGGRKDHGGGGQEARGGGSKPDHGPKGHDGGSRGQSAATDRGRGNDGSRGRGTDVMRIDRVRGPDRVVLAGRDIRRVQPAFLRGCPPGLAKKHNGCLPPGQAKKIYGDPRASLFRYAPWYDNARIGDWRYMNGYAYRLDSGSGLVNAFMPLLGGALFPGSAWPSAYDSYAADPFYRRYSSPYYDRYYDRYYGDNYDYRYVDGALFAVDPRTQQINSIAALLAGDPWAVGSPMPPGYYAYNVPLPYRSQYYDGPNDWYRYSDGYVYRIDPTTQLVTAIIELLA